MTEQKLNKLEQQIIKLLELANKNINQAEAIAAAAKAQELMAKYNIKLQNISKKPANIVAEFAVNARGKSYRFALATILANNYGVKLIWAEKMIPVFYGYENNAKTVTKIYEWLWQAIHRMADSYQTKIWKQGNGVKGVYNSFVDGFLVGLKKELDKNCTALKITVAEEVNTEFDKFMAEKGAGTFKTKKRNAPVDTCAFLQGVAEGSTIMQRKQVKAK